jgi:hypothetical protein
MIHLPRSQRPPIGLGMLSVVLGTTGGILVILPIVGLPLSALGVLMGLVGVVVALAGGRTRLRSCVLGTSLCVLSLVVNLAVWYAPEPHAPNQKAMWREGQDRPWVPPPASPNFWDDTSR